jgi:hypothetical protein
MVVNPPSVLPALTVTGSLKTATGATLGLGGAAAVGQPAAVTSVVTTAPTNSSPYGYTTSAQAQAIITAINAIINVLSAAGGGDGITA